MSPADLGTAEKHRQALERELVRVREMNRAFEQHISGSLTPPRAISPSRSPLKTSPSLKASPPPVSVGTCASASACRRLLLV